MTSRKTILSFTLKNQIIVDTEKLFVALKYPINSQIKKRGKRTEKGKYCNFLSNFLQFASSIKEKKTADTILSKMRKIREKSANQG